MHNKQLFPIIFTAVVFGLLSCNIQNEITPTHEEQSAYIKNVSPINPSTGDRIKIILSEPLTGNNYNGFVFFDNKWSYSDSVKNDTIFTFLPYIKGKTTVEIKVNISFSEKQNELTKVVSINNLCTKSICVIQNNEGKIQEKDIYPKDMLSENSKWIINEDNDTITFSAFMIVGDESNQDMNIKFLKRTDNVLPTFISFTQIKNESNGSSPSIKNCDTLKNGIIKIEDWNNNGIYSGIIYSELMPLESKTYIAPRTVFWVNAQSQLSETFINIK